MPFSTVTNKPLHTLVTNKPRIFSGTAHPNAIIAKREQERQEQCRLQRLSQVRPSSAISAIGRLSRPSSPRDKSLRGHESSLPTDSPSPAENPFMKDVEQVQMSFLVSPQRRLDDAALQLEVSTYEQAMALQEELQNWYFGDRDTLVMEFDNRGGSADKAGSSLHGLARGPKANCSRVHGRPAVNVLEEAATAVQARVVATSAFGPPPKHRDNGYARGCGHNAPERVASTSMHAVSGGCRGVAAAMAQRSGP